MGYSLNPVEYRIGYTRSWEDSWYLKDIFYPVFLHRILLLKSLINYLMYYGNYPNRESSWVFSHSEFTFRKNILCINIYMYDTILSGIFYDQTRKIKKKIFKSIRLPTFWMKKKIFDKKFRSQRLLKVMNLMNIFVSNQLIDHFKYRSFEGFERRWMNKLKRLRRKYGKKWLGEEEIYFWQVLFFLYENEYGRNLYYMQWLTQFFFKYYSKRKQTVPYMIMSIVGWAAVLSGIVHIFPKVFF